MYACMYDIVAYFCAFNRGLAIATGPAGRDVSLAVAAADWLVEGRVAVALHQAGSVLKTLRSEGEWREGKVSCRGQVMKLVHVS